MKENSAEFQLIKLCGGCGGGGLSRSVVSDLTLCNSLDCSPPGIFFRQEYWSGLPFPPPGDLPDPKIEPLSPVSLHCRQIFAR